MRHRASVIKTWAAACMAVVGLSFAQAQEESGFFHSFSPQIMTRAEYLKGYQKPVSKSSDFGLFIAQRTRLTYQLSHKHFDIVIAPQDIRVWGAASHLAPDTTAKLSLAEGYGAIKLGGGNRLKIGRQIIQYDEQRIIGSLDWAMQNRRHDLVLFQHANDTLLSFDIGAAWNQNRANPVSTFYQLENQYKTLQFIWLHRKWNQTWLSFLLLNHGFQFSRSTPSGELKTSMVFNQTLGFQGNYRPGKLKMLAWVYFQTGKAPIFPGPDGAPRQIRAFDAAYYATCQAAPSWAFTLGGEYLSGTSQDSAKLEMVNSFNPFYGTNHRFNGYMDYFYVGNHLNSVGLFDANLKIAFEKKRVGMHLHLHYFMAPAGVKDVARSTPGNFVDMAPSLGQEADFTLTLRLFDGVGLQAGYSQFFPTPTLRALKGGADGVVNNWAYIMVLFRPGTVWPKTGLF
jgi:hypothetical protein